jgi:hypothetical protein
MRYERSAPKGLSLNIATLRISRRFSAGSPAKSLDIEPLCLRFSRAIRRKINANYSVEY